IEVLHGEVSAFRWKEQHDSALIEAALTNGVRDGAWHADRWGVVFEVLFDTDEKWEAFRALPVVRAALDAVPDPVNGLLIYRGRGGGAGAGKPRRPRPAAGAGALALPEPQEPAVADLTRGHPERVSPAGAVAARGAGRAAGLSRTREPGTKTVQDGKMTDTRAAEGGMVAAIERSGYYPGLVADAVASAVEAEPVVSYVVHHDAHFDPGMEVRRHMTVL